MNPAQLFLLLTSYFGRLQWWPVDHAYHRKQGSDPRFEIIVGAILTQNTAWSNVEKALHELKCHNLLNVQALNHVDELVLITCIRSSGFFNQKAQRLRLFCSFLIDEYNGEISKLFLGSLTQVRQRLLSLKGIGHETADSILLYAGNKPVFIVDAYTKRLCQRLALPVSVLKYDVVQNFFEQQLSKSFDKSELVDVYQQYHAMIVELAKQFCQIKPRCLLCPIQQYCSLQQGL